MEKAHPLEPEKLSFLFNSTTTSSLILNNAKFLQPWQTSAKWGTDISNLWGLGVIKDNAGQNI